MFHFIVKPRPPTLVFRVTPGHDVDSSATVTTPEWCLCTVAFISCRNATASSSPDRRARWVSTGLPVASSRGRASRQRRPTRRPSTWNSSNQKSALATRSCAPRADRSRTRRCPSRVARRAADRRARTAQCRRSGQRPLVLREVRGHPVDDDADTGAVQPVDEGPEVVGGAETCRGGVVRRHLVPPRPAVRVFGDRQQFDVREAGLDDVRTQRVGQFDVVQPDATSPDGPRRRSAVPGSVRVQSGRPSIRGRSTDVRTR